MLNYYEILEVERSATEKEIKSAYRKLAKKWHPDTTVFEKEYAADKFKELTIAYNTLSDSERRKNYDYNLDYEKRKEAERRYREQQKQEAERRYREQQKQEAERRYREQQQEAERRYREQQKQEAERRYREQQQEAERRYREQQKQEAERRYREQQQEAERRYREQQKQEAERRYREQQDNTAKNKNSNNGVLKNLKEIMLLKLNVITDNIFIFAINNPFKIFLFNELTVAGFCFFSRNLKLYESSYYIMIISLVLLVISNFILLTLHDLMEEHKFHISNVSLKLKLSCLVFWVFFLILSDVLVYARVILVKLKGEEAAEEFGIICSNILEAWNDDLLLGYMIFIIGIIFWAFSKIFTDKITILRTFATTIMIILIIMVLDVIKAI